MDALPLRTSNDVHHAKQEQMKHKTWKYMQQTYNIDEKAKAHIFGLLLAQTNIRIWLSHTYIKLSGSICFVKHSFYEKIA